MGKRKISITIDENLSNEIARLMEKGRFRNRSHVLEYGLIKLLEEENG